MLCPHAAAIANCEGFAKACAEADEPIKAPRLLSMAWLGTAFVWLARAVLWLLILGLVVALAVPIVLALLRRRRQPVEPGALTVSAAAVPTVVDLGLGSNAEELLQRAHETARRGELGVALELYLASSLVALDGRRVLRISKDKTNGEYVRGCVDEEARGPLRELVSWVERVKFGGEAPTVGMVDEAGRYAMALVRSAVVAVACLCFFGCGGASSLTSEGRDPAGDEVLLGVLRRQGIEVLGLDRSLASLAPPKSGDAAVLVDVDKTPLDDETRSHLAHWVEGGGVLILAGDVGGWPKDFGASPTFGTGEVQGERGRAFLVEPGGLKWDALPVAERGDVLYAGFRRVGDGEVLGLATSELLTNAGLARGENATVLVAILEVLEARSVRVATSGDGISPPANPVAGLVRAGLGIALLQAVPFVALLFLAYGVRMASARVEGAPARRAFAEHIEATGTLYARSHAASHALAVYGRFAKERLRGRMPRGQTDVALFLASRSGVERGICDVVWSRAQSVRTGDAPRGDELEILGNLQALVATASAAGPRK
jgi:hypothetical protein